MNKKRIIVDVREPTEYARGHVDGAINIPPDEILTGAKKLEGIDDDAEIILYCVSGSRSAVCMQILSRLGFTNLVNGVNASQVARRYDLPTNNE